MTQTPNNMTEHPIEIYSAMFAQKDPQLLSARSGVAYDPKAQRFSCTLLGRGIDVVWPSMEAVYAFDACGSQKSDTVCSQAAVGDVKIGASAAVDKKAMAEATVDDKTRILLGRLLLEGTLVPAAGAFLSYEEIPNGEQYYEPFHGRCIMRLAYMFRSVEQFSTACQKLGGVATASAADAAYEFAFLEDLKIRLLYWQADEEFGPNAQFLFSDNFLLAFTSDDIACAGDIILGALKKCR